MMDKTFWKFLLGFAVIIGISLLAIVIFHDPNGGIRDVSDLIANFFR